MEKEIAWLFEGHLGSLLATEELVEEGHIRCAPGECVTIASRLPPQTKTLSVFLWLLLLRVSGCRPAAAVGQHCMLWCPSLLRRRASRVRVKNMQSLILNPCSPESEQLTRNLGRSRYKSDKRLGQVRNDVGVLGERHSEGTWWVRFDLVRHLAAREICTARYLCRRRVCEHTYRIR